MAQVNINGVWRSVVTQASSNAFLEMLGGSPVSSLGLTALAHPVSRLRLSISKLSPSLRERHKLWVRSLGLTALAHPVSRLRNLLHRISTLNSLPEGRVA